MNFTVGRIVAAVLGTIFALAAIITTPMLFENLDASEFMVVQSPISGDLKVYTDPGMQWQGFGTVTKYPRRNELKFLDAECVKENDKMTTSTGGLPIRFYDGGNATLCGTISWLMPVDPKSIIDIHKEFRSAEAFEIQAIRRSMQSAATFSGPTMSSFESAAGRRNELLQILNDQTNNGVYKTLSKNIRAKDVTGVEKDMTITEIVKDDKGQPLRAQASYVQKYNVQMLPMTISHFAYEKRVEEQIQQQQAATNAAVVAIANAKKADQDALTAEAQGKATAAKAEWEQKTIAAKTIAQAEAQVTIANASVKEAEAFKKAETLRGEGEAARKRLVMEADGQLDKKLEALVSINAKYAEAIQNAQPGAWSPSVVMGGSGQGNGGQNASTLVDLMTAKTAKELGVDMSVKAGAAAKK
jgi:regulator of protease activity HflC (stomatin/prohibitin superfamily)